jgi:hypothetical protein
MEGTWYVGAESPIRFHNPCKPLPGKHTADWVHFSNNRLLHQIESILFRKDLASEYTTPHRRTMEEKTMEEKAYHAVIKARRNRLDPLTTASTTADLRRRPAAHK